MTEEAQKQRYAVVEFETSQNKRSNKIIEITILILEEESENQAKIIDTYNSLINPETKIAPEVLESTGITLEEIAEAPIFAAIAEDIEHFTEGSTLLVCDQKEKKKLLDKEFKKAAVEFKRDYISLEDIVKKELPEIKEFDLDLICSELEITKSEHHKSRDHAIVILEIFQNLHYKIKTNNGVEISYSKIHNAHPALDLKLLSKLSSRSGLLQLYNDGQAVYVERFQSLSREVPKYLLFFKKEYDQEIDSIQTAQFHDPLIALLKKEERIRRLKPTLNYNNRKKAWGVFHNENPFDLKVMPLLKGQGTLLHFAASEEEALHWIDVQKQVASQDEYTYIDMDDKKLMARQKKESERLLRSKVRPLLEYPHDDFVVMGPGRDDDELSCHFFVKRKLFGHAFLSGQQVFALDKCPPSVKPIKENDFLKFLILKELEIWGKGNSVDHSIKVFSSEKKVTTNSNPNRASSHTNSKSGHKKKSSKTSHHKHKKPKHRFKKPGGGNGNGNGNGASNGNGNSSGNGNGNKAKVSHNA